MKRWQAVLAALLAVLSPAAVWAERSGVGDVEVEVIGHGGRSLPEYPLRREDRPGIYKAYLEAKRGQNYSIRIRNRSNQRVGVVVLFWSIATVTVTRLLLSNTGSQSTCKVLSVSRWPPSGWLKVNG